jgi:hypothetical protein
MSRIWLFGDVAWSANGVRELERTRPPSLIGRAAVALLDQVFVPVMGRECLRRCKKMIWYQPPPPWRGQTPVVV